MNEILSTEVGAKWVTMINRIGSRFMNLVDPNVVESWLMCASYTTECMIAPVLSMHVQSAYNSDPHLRRP